MPVDLLEDLKRVAPAKDLLGYQSLIKFHVRQGLRQDLERLWELEERAKKERERVSRADVEEALHKIGLDKEKAEAFLERRRVARSATIFRECWHVRRRGTPCPGSGESPDVVVWVGVVIKKKGGHDTSSDTVVTAHKTET